MKRREFIKSVLSASVAAALPACNSAQKAASGAPDASVADGPLPDAPLPDAPSSSPISATFAPARSSGISPLYVFFDATGTTDPSYTSNPFHELTYTWDFGETSGPSSGKWSYGNPSFNDRNKATGPLAAHVFEIPEGGGDKTFTVTLTVSDGTHTVKTTRTVTVYDPLGANGYGGWSSGNHYLFDPTGNFTGADPGVPSKNKITTSSFSDAVNTYAAPGRRLLFRSGQTFTAATAAAVLKVNGPGHIGKFGSDADPIISYPAANTNNATGMLQFSNQAQTSVIGDWRVVDLQIQGDGSTNEGNNGIFGLGNLKQLTMLRLTFTGWLRGVDFYIGFDHPILWEQMTVQDCTFNNLAAGAEDGNVIFLSGKYFAAQGNQLDLTGMTNAHGIRNHYLWKSIITHTQVANVPSANACLKLHGPPWTSGTYPAIYQGSSGYTDQVIISDNKWAPGAPYLVHIAPQSNIDDERGKNIICERNWYQVTTGSAARCLSLAFTDTTVRNELFDATEGGQGYDRRMLFTTQEGITGSTPAPTNLWIYNNTFYVGDAVAIQNLGAIWIDAGTLQVTAKNNLFYSKAGGTHRTVTDNSGGSATITQSNNSATPTKDPSFKSATPASPPDFELTASSYADGAGTAVPVDDDYAGQTRTAKRDLGFYAFDHA